MGKAVITFLAGISANTLTYFLIDWIYAIKNLSHPENEVRIVLGVVFMVVWVEVAIISTIIIWLQRERIIGIGDGGLITTCALSGSCAIVINWLLRSLTLSGSSSWFVISSFCLAITVAVAIYGVVRFMTMKKLLTDS
jgi:hypothetical protein